MRLEDLQLLRQELEKGAALQSGMLQRASAQLMKAPKPAMPKPPGTFGIRDAMKSAAFVPSPDPARPERMTPAKWKQTAKDLPLIIGASGLGWGLGKTIGDLAGEHLARHGVPPNPAAAKYAPLVGSVLASGASYALGRSRGIQAERRDAAEAKSREKKSGVEPAPQSQRIPKKKWSDPWRYDPRAPGMT